MKKRKNKENKESRLYYLNHKNLIGEIENYGYVFKFRKLLFTYLCVLAGCILAGLLYKLPLYGYVVIIVFALLQTPFLVRNYYKSLYEQRRFRMPANTWNVCCIILRQRVKFLMP